jgi:dipeptidyl-peptidase-3
MNNLSERYQINPIPLPELSTLSKSEQKVLYHLHLSAMVSRDLLFIQSSPYSLAVKETLEALSAHPDLPDGDAHNVSPLRSRIDETLQLVWACGGIYHESKGDRIIPSFTNDEFNAAIATLDETMPSEDTLFLARTGLFDPSVPEYKTDKDGVSGFNTHDITCVTESERRAVINLLNESWAVRYPKRAPPMGLNLYVCRDEFGNLNVERYSTTCKAHGGRVAKILTEKVKHLRHALAACDLESPLSLTISTLIKYYETGDPEDFLAHSEAWMQDTTSNITLISGFIETYDDPMGVHGSFETILGVREPVATGVIHAIINQAQYIEDNLPCRPEYKRNKAVGAFGSAINIVALAGPPSPFAPLGNNLPNTNWLKAEKGSRASIFMNVIEGRDYHGTTAEMQERFIAPAHLDAVHKYKHLSFVIMVYLHECAGHPSGEAKPGVNPDTALKECYSFIEECRADLVAYYMMGDKDFIASLPVEIDDHDAFLKATYASYLSEGCMYQLARIPDGTTKLGAAHFQNRQANNKWVYEYCLAHNGIKWVEGKHGKCLEIIDTSVVRKGYGEFLSMIQDIKSEGDYNAARALLDEYGAPIDPVMFESVKDRVKDIEFAPFTGFLMPSISPTTDAFSPYQFDVDENFWDNQLKLNQMAM